MASKHKTEAVERGGKVVVGAKRGGNEKSLV